VAMGVKQGTMQKGDIFSYESEIITSMDFKGNALSKDLTIWKLKEGVDVPNTFNANDFEGDSYSEVTDIEYDRLGKEIYSRTRSYNLLEDGITRDYYEGYEVVNEYEHGMQTRSLTSYFRIDEEAQITFYKTEEKTINLSAYDEFDRVTAMSIDTYHLRYQIDEVTDEILLDSNGENLVHDGLAGGSVFESDRSNFNSEWRKVSGLDINNLAFDGAGNALIVETLNYNYYEEGIKDFINGRYEEKHYDRSGRVDYVVGLDFLINEDSSRYYTTLTTTSNEFQRGIPSYVEKAVVTTYKALNGAVLFDSQTGKIAWDISKNQPDVSAYAKTLRSTTHTTDWNKRGQSVSQVTVNELWSDAYTPGSDQWVESDVQRVDNEYDRYGRMKEQKTESLFSIGGKYRSTGWTIFSVLSFDRITDKPKETVSEFYTLKQGMEEVFESSDQAFDTTKYENLWGKRTLNEYNIFGDNTLIITDNYRHASHESEEIFLIDGSKTDNTYNRGRLTLSYTDNYRYEISDDVLESLLGVPVDTEIASGTILAGMDALESENFIKIYNALLNENILVDEAVFAELLGLGEQIPGLTLEESVEFRTLIEISGSDITNSQAYVLEKLKRKIFEFAKQYIKDSLNRIFIAGNSTSELSFSELRELYSKSLTGYTKRENLEFEGNNPTLSVVENYKPLTDSEGNLLDGLLNSDPAFRDNAEFELANGQEIMVLEVDAKGQALRSVTLNFMMVDGVKIYSDGEYAEKKYDINGNVYDSKVAKFDLQFNENELESLINSGSAPGLEGDENTLVQDLLAMKEAYEAKEIPFDLFTGNDNLFRALLGIESDTDPYPYDTVPGLDNIPNLEGEDESQLVALLTDFISDPAGFGDPSNQTNINMLLDLFVRAFPESGVDNLLELENFDLNSLIVPGTNLGYFEVIGNTINTLTDRFIQIYNILPSNPAIPEDMKELIIESQFNEFYLQEASLEFYRLKNKIIQAITQDNTLAERTLVEEFEDSDPLFLKYYTVDWQEVSYQRSFGFNAQGNPALVIDEKYQYMDSLGDPLTKSTPFVADSNINMSSYELVDGRYTEFSNYDFRGNAANQVIYNYKSDFIEASDTVPVKALTDGQEIQNTYDDWGRVIYQKVLNFKITGFTGDYRLMYASANDFVIRDFINADNESSINDLIEVLESASGGIEEFFANILESPLNEDNIVDAFNVLLSNQTLYTELASPLPSSTT
ncbi:hypothetical protein BVX93_00165, partial [bacterium B13(2017)]